MVPIDQERSDGANLSSRIRRAGTRDQVPSEAQQPQQRDCFSAVNPSGSDALWVGNLLALAPHRVASSGPDSAGYDEALEILEELLRVDRQLNVDKLLSQIVNMGFEWGVSDGN